MGRDKALVEVGGRALAARVADALRAAGCGEVLAIGGDPRALGALGLTPVADRWPGQGPLAGLATALDAGAATGAPGAVDDEAAPVVVVAPCDLVHPAAEVVTALVTALVAAPTGVAVTVPEQGGRRFWLPSAWRAERSVREVVIALVEGGARRLDAVADAVRAVPVAGLDPDALRDADRPGDLPTP
jgi:molybdopterin-guanine dinucleotide biosynthesis protein A